MASNNEYNNLKELGKSNFEIAKGESDIRTWVVKNGKGNILGEVEELIFDTDAHKAVFIVLNLDKNELNLKERKVLLPLDHAEINLAYKNVIYKGLSPNEIAVLPTYEKGIFTRNSIDLTNSTFMSMKNENSLKHSGDNESGNGQSSAAGNYFEYKRSAVPLSENKNVHIIDKDENVISHFKPFTVIGVFDHSHKAQAVIEYLRSKGFGKEDITVSTRHTELSYERSHRDESGIKNFFQSLFSNEDDLKRFSDATVNNYVISVDVSSVDEAEKAANILDQHGSLNMKGDHNDPTGNARVFKRHTAV